MSWDPTHQEAAVIAQARTWTGTPHVHMARVRGAGVDCGQLIIAAHVDAGEVEDIDTGFYTRDWMMHRGEEKYLGFVEAHLRRCDASEAPLSERLAADSTWRPRPASVLVVRVGKTYSHGMLVTDWPCIIHAYVPSGVTEEVSILGSPMAVRPMRVYSRWAP